MCVDGEGGGGGGRIIYSKSRELISLCEREKEGESVRFLVGLGF